MPKYTATFSDGTVKKRKSPRTYTHAYRSRYVRKDNGASGYSTGFAGSRALAEKASRTYAYADWITFLDIEIVEVVVS